MLRAKQEQERQKQKTERTKEKQEKEVKALKLKGELELRADVMYRLLGDEITDIMKELHTSFKNLSDDRLNNENIVETLLVDRTTMYRLYLAAMQTEFTLKEINAIIKIEENNLDFIRTIAKKVNKEKVNVFNMKDSQEYIKTSVALLAEYGGND